MTLPPDHQTLGLSLLLQIARRVRTAASPAEIGFVAVNESKQLLNYRQGALWLADKGVLAVSGIPEADRSSPYIQWLNRLFQALGQDAGCRRIGPAGLPAPLAAAWGDWFPPHAAVAPLRAREGETLGMILFAREVPWEDQEVALLTELAAIYAHGLTALRTPQGIGRGIGNFLGKSKLRISVALLLAGALFWPVRMSVQAPAEVVPKDPFVIRSPLDGVIDRFHVRPNEAVREGEALFSFDQTNLRARMGVAGKAFEVAAEEYRQAAQLALADDKSRADVTPRQGKMEEKATELSYSRELFQRLVLRAPRPGIVVFAEQSDWIGRYVSIGEKVLVIADPERVEILIHLPVADAIELNIGTPVSLYPAMDALQPLAGTLRYAAYKPEVTPAGFVAYRLKADFAPGVKPPRIGLTGTARIYGQKVALGYYLFRRPLAAIQQRFGW